MRDSFNEVRLQPFSDEWQTVDNFLLKILPAARLRHHHDFYSNVIHHFEIAEPHSTLLVESNLRVTTRPRPPLAATETPWPLARIGEAARETRVFDFLQESRFVELSPEVWRLALDTTAGITDTWQAALALMNFVHGHLKYESNSTTRPHARARRVEGPARRLPGFCACDDQPVPHAENSRALRQRLSGDRGGQRDARVGGGADSRPRLASRSTRRTTARRTRPM